MRMSYIPFKIHPFSWTCNSLRYDNLVTFLLHNKCYWNTIEVWIYDKDSPRIYKAIDIIQEICRYSMTIMWKIGSKHEDKWLTNKFHCWSIFGYSATTTDAHLNHFNRLLPHTYVHFSGFSYWFIHDIEHLPLL